MSENLPLSFARRPVALALAGVLAVATFQSVLGMQPKLAAPQIHGTAVAVDGDTLDFSGRRVRLDGIDAPELAQTCSRRFLGSWDCGKAAQKALANLVDGRPVTCEGRGHDKYGRDLAVCAADGRDLNAELVRLGMAWAFVKYSSAYVTDEAKARADRAGIWQGKAEPAWAYREAKWQTAEPAAPAGCAIKGNITGHGRIYHVPWSEWYGKVKVDAARGERWFCNEAEAVAAGWRPARTP